MSEWMHSSDEECEDVLLKESELHVTAFFDNSGESKGVSLEDSELKAFVDKQKAVNTVKKL